MLVISKSNNFVTRDLGRCNSFLQDGFSSVVSSSQLYIYVENGDAAWSSKNLDPGDIEPNCHQIGESK
jgi:hypothetical protein